MECRQCREHRMDNIAGYGLEGAHLADLVQALLHGALAVQGVRLRALLLLDGCRHQLHALLQLLRRLQGASTLTALSDCSPRWSEGEEDTLMHACRKAGKQIGLPHLNNLCAQSLCLCMGFCQIYIDLPNGLLQHLTPAEHSSSELPYLLFPDAGCATLPKETGKQVQGALLLQGFRHLFLTSSLREVLRQQDVQPKPDACL